jgi:dienelactone hydrolase
MRTLLSVGSLVLLIGSGSAANQLTLSATPKSSLADAPIAIRVHAAPRRSVTVSASTTIFGQQFKSAATFRADSAGNVVLGRDAPLSGSYSGVDGMGLFWSMRATGKRAAASQSHTYDYLAPRLVTLRASGEGSTVTKTVTRLVLAPGIHYTDIRTPDLYARFYVHDGPGRRPTVIVVGGAEGGLPEDRPAILASHGFNTLALAYFGANELPSSLTNVPVERVQTAIAWLQQRPEVDAEQIGIVGGSKGAELALLAASLFAQLRAVVAFSPSSVVYPGLYYGNVSGPAPSSWSYRGTPLPYVNGSPSKDIEATISADIHNKRPVSYAPEYLAELQNATNLDAATIPVEQINGPILLISGDDDRLWPSSFMAGQILSRLHAKHHSFSDVWLRYANAGHDIGEPYYIYSDSTLAHLARYDMALGGTPAANKSAGADAWPRVIAFLKSHLAAR